MTVSLQPGESQESLLKRFRKAVSQSQILSIHRKKRWFVSKGELQRRQREKGIRKARRKAARQGPSRV